MTNKSTDNVTFVYNMYDAYHYRRRYSFPGTYLKIIKDTLINIAFLRKRKNFNY